jgi:nitrogenase molybdenum-iron protein NifN
MSTVPIVKSANTRPNWVATRNSCKLCAPLGASMVMRGIEGALPFLHGSQGCATYMRRYIISHFREPMDIAASGFSEATTIFGGADNLRRGIRNVTSQYQPSLIGIATTCLSETIGEDVGALLKDCRRDPGSPVLVHVSTPSYRGTHVDGFHDAVRAVVEQLAEPGATSTAYANDVINLFPGMVSPADIRCLKEIAKDFGLSVTLFPDYSETLDAPVLEKYSKVPTGGTPVAALRATASARASIEFGRTLRNRSTAASFLEEKFSVPAHRVGLPIGVTETDAFLGVMEKLSHRHRPARFKQERGRLIDAYIDGHKYVSGKRAVVFGDEDLVVGLASLLAEFGVVPVLCASGGKSGAFAKSVAEVTSGLAEPIEVREGIDFMSIGEIARDLKPDFFIGSSKGYATARALGVPLIRVGFPIHDRVGAQRILHLGYGGAQQLFDRIVNTLLEHQQDQSPTGYSYL